MLDFRKEILTRTGMKADREMLARGPMLMTISDFAFGERGSRFMGSYAVKDRLPMLEAFWKTDENSAYWLPNPNKETVETYGRRYLYEEDIEEIPAMSIMQISELYLKAYIEHFKDYAEENYYANVDEQTYR